MKRLVAVLTAVFLLAPTLPVQAASVSQLAIASSYELPAEGRTIRTSHTLTPAATGDFTIDLPVVGVHEAKLTYDRQTDPIQLTQEEVEASRMGQTIHLTRFHFSLTQKKTATLSFDTDSLLREYAKTTVFALPQLPASAANVTSIEIEAPVERGLAVNYSPVTPDSSIGGGQQSYRFEADEQGVPRVLMLFGTAASAQAKWQTRLSNGSWWWRTMQLVLPPDTNQQTVFLKSVDPKPSQLHVDQDGNIIAEYRIGPKKSVNVTAEALIGLRSVTYNTTNTRTLADLPQQLSGYMTGHDEPADSAVLVVVKRLYDEAEASIESLGVESVVTQLRDKLQSAGVPVRTIHGVRFVSGGQLVDSHTDSQWLEVFVPGIGWMTLDPASGAYGRSDFQHLALAITSPLSQPSYTPVGDGLSVDFVDEPLPSTEYTQTTVGVTKFILLPGLSLTRTRLQLPQGGVLDNATIAGAHADAYLGSLAPLQRVSRWSMSLLSASWQGGTVEFGPGGSSGIGEVYARGPATVSYWGAVIEVLMLAGLITLVVKWRRNRSRPSTRRMSREMRRNHSPEDDIPAEDLLED